MPIYDEIQTVTETFAIDTKDGSIMDDLPKLSHKGEFVYNFFPLKIASYISYNLEIRLRFILVF